MSNYILAMGANHVDHDKLVQLVGLVGKQRIQGEAAYKELERAREIYGAQIKFRYPYKWISEEKVDGYSYIANNGEMMSRKLSTKKGNEGNPIFKTGHVPHLVNPLKFLADYIDADFHGELYKPGGISDDVTSIMGCKEDKAIFRQKEESARLHYMIHDIRRYNGIILINEPWYVRRAILEMIFERWINNTILDQYLHLSEVLLDPITSFNRIVSNGGEGIMIKDVDGIYLPDKKPANNWIKCKKEVTLDVVIMGYNNDGSGKNAGLFKSIQVGIYDDNCKLKHVGDVHSGISDDLRRRMHENRDEYIDKVIEVDAMDFDGKRYSMRHGRLVKFRHDKLPINCTADGLRFKTDIL